MKLLTLFLSVIFLISFGCEDPVQNEISDPDILLEHNRAWWESQGINSYQYQVTKFCYECWASGIGEVIITVEHNEIVEIKRLDYNTTVAEKYWIDFDTIDELFDIISSWLDSNPRIFEVEYHSIHGYPTFIEIDIGYSPDAEVQIVDAGVKVEVEDLTILD